MIALAVLFLLVLFLIKNTPVFKNKETYQAKAQAAGLAYDATIGDLVEKDTDGDTIPDWQEPLYGLDPTTKETVPGTPDIATINKLRATQGEAAIGINGQNQENLTETDKFSRELFSAVASLSENGTLSQETADQISSSLADKIKNPAPEKVFDVSDIKIINDDSVQAIKNYKDTMNNIQKKYPDKGNVLDILQRFVVDENSATVDTSVLPELDPIIKQTEDALNAILKVSVPQSLALWHLDLINAGEILIENEKNIQLFETDPILSLGAMSKYEENINSFQSALLILVNAVDKKLSN